MFRSKKQEMVKREVIIVLTPFVLPEEQVIGKNMPMDEDNFDSVGHQLFRDAYRIRAEDTFDLNYLYENKQLQRMKQLADRIVAGNRPWHRISLPAFLRQGRTGREYPVLPPDL